MMMMLLGLTLGHFAGILLHLTFSLIVIQLHVTSEFVIYSECPLCTSYAIILLCLT